MIEKGQGILVDFVAHVENKFRLEQRFFWGREVANFLNKSLIEHHMEEMEYKKD